MIFTPLWLRVVPENGVLCRSCFERRLGRPLTREDVDMSIPMNKDFEV